MKIIKNILISIKNAFWDFWDFSSHIVILLVGISLGASISVIEFKMSYLSHFESSFFILFAVLIVFVPTVILGVLSSLLLDFLIPRLIPFIFPRLKR